MPNLATPRPSRPSSPSKSHPPKPSVIIPPALPADSSSTAKVDETVSSTPFTLASLTCATPLSPSNVISSVPTDNPQSSNPSLDRDSSESMNGSAGIGISPDILAVGNLLSTMKATLGALSATFDFLGEQTTKAAALGPAIEATHQIHVLRAQLSEQYTQQEARMKDVKALLKDVFGEQPSEQLRARMDTMIQETVRGEIKKRVEHQLSVQIPQNLREQVMQHKRQILEVQTKLHNSEARRYNATLRSTASFTEPLRPLLRPLPTPFQSPCHPANATTVPPTPAVPRPPAPTPTVGNGCGVELEPPTPSPFFPRNLASLFDLNSDAARALVREYGLVEDDGVSTSHSPGCVSGKDEGGAPCPPTNVQQTPTPTSATEDAGAAGSDGRERNLTRFMVHIGVPYQMVPNPNSTKRKRLAPLITTF